jgi:hypothetical protein
LDAWIPLAENEGYLDFGAGTLGLPTVQGVSVKDSSRVRAAETPFRQSHTMVLSPVSLSATISPSNELTVYGKETADNVLKPSVSEKEYNSVFHSLPEWLRLVQWKLMS